ncbi:hypothetical protein CTI12_AA267840 [Artemisia annua]|uniref:Uncharacterized protein n=1 Tax=Artemisia annua TaxID=35608 RepID=A0A2U1NGT0_ARTAN|nr:hypothetical protein CTI12_AA267840 [Artemisia annua]
MITKILAFIGNMVKGHFYIKLTRKTTKTWQELLDHSREFTKTSKNNRNSEKNNGKGNNQEKRKGDDLKNQKGKEEYTKDRNKGNECEFDGDLNGEGFPGLQSQVNTSSSTANSINNDNDLSTHVNDDNMVIDSNDHGTSSNANDTNKNASVAQDNMSSNVVASDKSLKERIGRLGFARVLVELSAEKQFTDVIEVAYRKKDASITVTKFVQVEYAWKPSQCSHFCVFGHEEKTCRMIPKDKDEEKQKDEQCVNNDGFKEVQYRKNRNESDSNNDKRNDQTGQNGYSRGTMYSSRKDGHKHNLNKEYMTKRNKEVGTKTGIDKGKEPSVPKDKGSSSKSKTPPKVNNIPANSKSGHQKTTENILGNNSFAHLDSLVNDEDIRPNTDERKKVDEVLGKNGDPTVTEWESWNEVMKSELMQIKPNPLLETIWVSSFLSFQTKKSQKDDIFNQLLAVQDLFQYITASSGSCSSSISIALLAPVIYKLYDVLIGLKDKEVDVKQKKKLRKEVKSFVDVILGYCNVCCEGIKDDEDEDSGLIRPLSDLVSIWVCGEGGGEKLSEFFPVLSDGVVDWVNEESGGGGVGVIGGAVICEAFLLKLCLKFGEGGSRVEVLNELRSWAVCSVTGFSNFYFFDVLVKMLLEPNLSVMSLLSSDDELFLRKVLYDVVILPDYSFLHLEKLGHLSINHIKNNILARVMLTHEAIELSRKNKDHTKAVSYTNAFSGSHLPTLITKLVTSELGIQGNANQLKGSSPLAFLKWMLELESQGLTLSEGFMSKHHAKLVSYGSRSDVDQSSYKLDAGKSDSDLLFFIDNKGKDDEGDDEKIDDSMNDAFVAAARSMQSDTSESGKKRKETRDEKKKDPVKFPRYNLVDLGSKSGKKTSSSNKDDSGSDSEVEDPDSDEDLE